MTLDAITCANSVAAYWVSRSVQSSEMYSLDRPTRLSPTGCSLSGVRIQLLLLFSACFLYYYKVNYRWISRLCQACAEISSCFSHAFPIIIHTFFLHQYLNALNFYLDSIQKLCYNIDIENAMTQTSRQRRTFREVPAGARHQVGNCWTHCWAVVLNTIA